MKYYLPEEDLKHILTKTNDLWASVKGKSVLLTGGTGFFGKWLTGAFIYANQELNLGARLYVLSRDPEKFLSAFPDFKDNSVTYLKGDVADFAFGDAPLDYIIHAATEASATLNVEEPALMFDTILKGTRNILDLASAKKVQSVLLTSSGAVYGIQPPVISHIRETDTYSPDVLANNSAYGEGKRVAEMLCSIYYHKHCVNTKIARCFAFAGPHLPLNAHYALGNFINNALNNQDISIGGDGSPYRSYLYAADLVIWLLTILVKGKPNQAYNVGSDDEISILELAKKIGNLAAVPLKVEVKQKALPNVAAARYVPSIDKTKQDLGLEVNTSLDEALRKTFDFYRSTKINTSI